MKIGYNLLRKDDLLPDADQSKILPLEDFKQAGCTNFCVDFSDLDRQQLKKVLSELKSGDTLVIPNFKVLGTSKFDFLQNLNLLKKKGIHLHSLEDDYLFSSHSMNTESLNLVKSLFPAQERAQRTNSTTNILKKTKRKKGRPKGIPPEKIQLINLLKAEYHDINIAELCRLANISRPSYYKYISN